MIANESHLPNDRASALYSLARDRAEVRNSQPTSMQIMLRAYQMRRWRGLPGSPEDVTFGDLNVQNRSGGIAYKITPYSEEVADALMRDFIMSDPNIDASDNPVLIGRIMGLS